jgi:signal transduction histidine kinase
LQWSALRITEHRLLIKGYFMDNQVIKVLLAEDDEDDYILIRELLAEVRDATYVLEWVPTYEEALEKMAYTENQVCLIDYRLGPHDGLEILESARERGFRAPVIFVTGREDYEIDIRAMKSGATDYLVKSQLTGPLLDRSIRYAIDRWQSEQSLRRAYEEMELRVEERTAELAAANAALKRSSDEVKFFAYSICHDLRNPVFALHGFVQRLVERSKDAMDEKGKEYCTRILKASEQIVDLVEKIYTFISAKETPVVIEKVALAEVFNLVRHEFRTQFEHRRLNWKEPEHAPDIFADRLSLMRILRNLVENALKYGGDGLTGIQINYSDDGVRHLICVTDDGAGLRESDREKLFFSFLPKQTLERLARSRAWACHRQGACSPAQWGAVGGTGRGKGCNVLRIPFQAAVVTSDHPPPQEATGSCPWGSTDC